MITVSGPFWYKINLNFPFIHKHCSTQGVKDICSENRFAIGHFQVAFCLYVKTILGEKPSIESI